MSRFRAWYGAPRRPRPPPPPPRAGSLTGPPGRPSAAQVDHPYSNRSDSFYFAGSPPRLIMHNKAEYEWTDE